MPDLPESGPYRLANSPSHMLHRAEQLAAERFTQLVGDSITLRQFAVLAAIAEAPGASQSDLMRSTGVDRSTLADMLTRMEKRDWVTRTPSTSDARALSVRLAPGGVTVLAATAKHARAADTAIMDLLPKTKGRTFLGTLTKLLRLAEEAAVKAERNARREAKRQARKNKRAAAAAEKKSEKKTRGKSEAKKA